MSRFPGDEPDASSGSHRPSGPHRSRPQRRPPRSLLIIIVIAVVVALSSGIATWLATGGQSRRTPLTDSPVRRPQTVPSSSTTTLPAPTTTTTTDQGSLPQTDALPPTNSPLFQSEMAALWAGIVSDSSSVALPAYFPEQAYEQLKTITDARGDYENRLVHDYSLDITAAHGLLGANPSSAVLVAVDVPEHYGHWVSPGVCDNRIGYFEVANSRVVYQQHGVTHSFGIASLISWRGVWYVVHLGAILRSSETGVVEDPEVGTGYSAPSSTC